MLKKGMKVVANWGAMHPVETGTITDVFHDGYVNVMFDGGIFRTSVTVRKDDYLNPKGSPIGVFLSPQGDLV